MKKLLKRNLKVVINKRLVGIMAAAMVISNLAPAGRMVYASELFDNAEAVDLPLSSSDATSDEKGTGCENCGGTLVEGEKHICESKIADAV